MSKTDRRRLKSQEAIKNAVIELISEKNFDDITMHDISNRANVSRATIYSNYIDKFDLLDKLMEEHINELRELCEPAADLDYTDANVIWFEYIQSHYLFFRTMFASTGAPYFHTRFLELLKKEFKNEIIFH